MLVLIRRAAKQVFITLKHVPDVCLHKCSLCTLLTVDVN
jgi:hypothetical protein